MESVEVLIDGLDGEPFEVKTASCPVEHLFMLGMYVVLNNGQEVLVAGRAAYIFRRAASGTVEALWLRLPSFWGVDFFNDNEMHPV